MHQWMCFDNPPDTSAAHLSDASSEARQKDIRSVMRIGGASVPQLMQEVKDVPVGAKHQRGADGDGAQRHGHPSVEAPDLKHTGRRSLKGTAHPNTPASRSLKGTAHPNTPASRSLKGTAHPNTPASRSLKGTAHPNTPASRSLKGTAHPNTPASRSLKGTAHPNTPASRSLKGTAHPNTPAGGHLKGQRTQKR